MPRLALSDTERSSLGQLRSGTDRASVYRDATIILQSDEGLSKAAPSRA